MESSAQHVIGTREVGASCWSLLNSCPSGGSFFSPASREMTAFLTPHNYDCHFRGFEKIWILHIHNYHQSVASKKNMLSELQIASLLGF